MSGISNSIIMFIHYFLQENQNKRFALKLTTIDYSDGNWGYNFKQTIFRLQCTVGC